MVRLLIAGYHGFGNCGDEAALLAMRNNILKINSTVQLTVLSNKPDETKLLYGISTVQRFNLFKVISAILQADIILEGGGSLLQDETSTRSLLYYLSIIFFAKLSGRKVMLYSNGIGPVSKKLNRYLIKYVVNNVDLITLREGLSGEELKNLGVTKPKTYITADPAFTLNGISYEQAKSLLIDENIPLDKKLIGVSVRAWSSSDKFIDTIANVLDFVIQKYDVNILLIPMQYPKDISITEKLHSKIYSQSYILKNKYLPEETLGIIGLLHFIISMRLHTLIFAGIKRVPMIGIVYDPKVLYYLKILKMPRAGDIRNESLKADEMKIQIDDIFNNRQHYVDILDDVVTDLIKNANKNDTYLKELIDDVNRNKK